MGQGGREERGEGRRGEEGRRWDREGEEERGRDGNEKGREGEGKVVIEEGAKERKVKGMDSRQSKVHRGEKCQENVKHSCKGKFAWCFSCRLLYIYLYVCLPIHCW